MKYIIRKTNDIVWSLVRREKKNELTGEEVRILRSGFPDKWIVLYEDAYGKIKCSRMDGKKIEKLFGVSTELLGEIYA